MARPLRLEFPGAIWHVTGRGNERRKIYSAPSDQRTFLSILGDVVRRFRWALHAYVLMSNHYHLLVETPEPNLSRGMHDLNGTYTQRFNRRHRRVGHLFQGRYHGILIEREAHLLEVVRYVVLNPVRAGLVASASDWTWSSYRATAGLAPVPPWLVVDWTLAQFDRSRSNATDEYCRFVAAGGAKDSRPWDRVEGQIFLGGARFLKEMHARAARVPLPDEIPKKQALVGRPTLAWIVRSTWSVLRSRDRVTGTPVARAMIAYLAREDAGIALAPIGAALSVKASMASRLARQGGKLMIESAAFRAGVAQVRARWLEAQ